MSTGPAGKVGLLGWPVEHSVSPAMHNAAFEALGLDWRYEPLPVPPGEIAAALARLRAEGYRGANVTVPHKEVVLAYLDWIADEAQAIGAVNTLLLRENGDLTGHNTDAAGFLAALCETGFEPEGRRALVLGAGGGARAVVYALIRAGCAVTVYNRTPQRATQLARNLLAHEVKPVVVDLDHKDLERFDLLVNATPAGMWPQVNDSPWPEDLPLPARWVVFDLVYNPAKTRLLDRARTAGATAIGGLGMLVHQGALAFELWTGRTAPLEVMRAAAVCALDWGSGERREKPCCDS